MMSRRITTAVAALLLAGTLGACGGDDDSDDAGPASIEDPDDTSSDEGNSDGEEVDEADVGLEYAQCMRDNGVNMPDPETGANGEFQIDLNMDEMDATEDEVQAAEEACKDILEQARTDREPLSPEEVAERRDQALAMAQCMRDKGWDFPDPVVTDDGGIQVKNPDGVGGPGDPDFEKFEDDRQACEDEAGMERPEGGGALNEAEGPEPGGST